jgi:hypothetical protein
MRENPKPPAPKAVTFINHTDQDFTHEWDGVPYTVPARSQMLMQDYLANHLAKHLTDKVMNEMGIPTDSSERASLLAKCFKPEEHPQVFETEEKLEQAKINEPTLEIPQVQPAVTAEAKIEDKKTPDANGVYCQECGSRSPYFHRKDCSKYEITRKK